MKGYIIKYFPEKGYGFIEVGNADKVENVFFHLSQMPTRNISVGQKVEFRTATTPKGKQAVDVQIVTEYGEEVYAPFADKL